MSEITIQEARRVIREAFEADPDFKDSYVANVAMKLYDLGLATEPEERNEAARSILELIFSESYYG